MTSGTQVSAAAVACEKAFGPGAHPVPICHEWNTIAHLNDDESKTEACTLSRAELQQFLDYADDQIDRAVRSNARGRWLPTAMPPCSSHLRLGVAAHRDLEVGSAGLGP